MPEPRLGDWPLGQARAILRLSAARTKRMQRPNQSRLPPILQILGDDIGCGRGAQPSRALLAYISTMPRSNIVRFQTRTSPGPKGPQVTEVISVDTSTALQEQPRRPRPERPDAFSWSPKRRSRNTEQSNSMTPIR